ncbi:MAG: Flavodoxin reductase (Ferredoxin-NADPH reductase) family 1 [Polaromonas sp.]|jgi:vanillate O-demethylase ferredoxin subunit|nr:Flavodoxin reductase (Ferredoxin-NADPH reductase) family 1 [Polaromonas sp.]
MSTGPEAPLRVRVARKQPAGADIAIFELVSADGAALPPFSAGSHVDVALGNGLTRQYSLCNDPGESHRYQIAVLKDTRGRGGSRAMHDSVHEGGLLSISAPRNHFALAHGAKESVLLAGGIGITPLICMAERLSMIGQPFTLHYCTRSPDRTAFRDRIETSRYRSHVRFHFDDGPQEQKLDLAALLGTSKPGVHVYTCGPKGFMDAVLSTARASGWPEDQLHYEFFSAEPVKLATDGAFEVQLASSGRVIPVAADQTVVAALAAGGVEVPVSCEQGVCGTCLVRVLQGEPDHRDFYLTPEEQAANDQFLPCCSRARSARLVLDL